ncbi:MAG: nicotinate (nicotinamide) nucleotide adenylyltransferase [Anaerolineales bacterium]|nr:nicotinate (nicotinamide) nucleotide adenylyltransferase [Anaerolineales bacterium]
MEGLGILGGTFDPPHNAHLALAERSLRQLALSCVLWVLTPDPPHKADNITPYPLRREMLRAAIAGIPAFELSEVETERRGPHYMVDTLRILRRRNPGTEFTLLLGGDSLRDILRWHHPRQLIRMCTLAVLRRPGTRVGMARLEKFVPGISKRTVFIEAPPMQISSTNIRSLVREGKSIAGQVPPAVGEIIRRNGLYR